MASLTFQTFPPTIFPNFHHNKARSSLRYSPIFFTLWEWAQHLDYYFILKLPIISAASAQAIGTAVGGLGRRRRRPLWMFDGFLGRTSAPFATFIRGFPRRRTSPPLHISRVWWILKIGVSFVKNKCALCERTAVWKESEERGGCQSNYAYEGYCKLFEMLYRLDWVRSGKVRPREFTSYGLFCHFDVNIVLVELLTAGRVPCL